MLNLRQTSGNPDPTYVPENQLADIKENIRLWLDARDQARNDPEDSAKGCQLVDIDGQLNRSLSAVQHFDEQGVLIPFGYVGRLFVALPEDGHYIESVKGGEMMVSVLMLHPTQTINE